MPVLLPVMLAGAHLTLAAAPVPHLDIAPTCRAAAAAVLPCRRDERRARDKLEASWTGYTADQRKRCASVARMGGAPSYVDLLTCLEMARAADSLPGPDPDRQLDDLIRR
jgi:hypothetical protein